MVIFQIPDGLADDNRIVPRESDIDSARLMSNRIEAADPRTFIFSRSPATSYRISDEAGKEVVFFCQDSVRKRIFSVFLPCSIRGGCALAFREPLLLRDCVT